MLIRAKGIDIVKLTREYEYKQRNINRGTNWYTII